MLPTKEYLKYTYKAKICLQSEKKKVSQSRSDEKTVNQTRGIPIKIGALITIHLSFYISVLNNNNFVDPLARF